VWIAPRAEERDPKPPSGYIVSLVRLHERGFDVLTGRFVRALYDYYQVELHNFAHNTISLAAVFVALCEGYLGVEAHWDLWVHLFHGELYTDSFQGQLRRYARAGGLMLHVRGQRANLYIPSKMTTNNTGWTRGWFYLRNDNERLLAFTDKVLREKPDSWGWGVVDERQARLEVFIYALHHLAKKGLTAATVIANFHRQCVIPLLERRLPIFDLTPEAAAEGSRMSSELLSLDAAAQTARSAVARFPSDPEDLWKIKMRPEKGYISLVSPDFDCH